MSDINKLPKTQTGTIDNFPDMEIDYPKNQVNENAVNTKKKWGNFDLNGLFGAISDVAQATSDVATRDQDGFGAPNNMPNQDPRYYRDIPNTDQQTRILGMKPLVFTISLLGITGLIIGIVYVAKKSSKKAAAGA